MCGAAQAMRAAAVRRQRPQGPTHLVDVSRAGWPLRPHVTTGFVLPGRAGGQERVERAWTPWKLHFTELACFDRGCGSRTERGRGRGGCFHKPQSCIRTSGPCVVAKGRPCITTDRA